MNWTRSQSHRGGLHHAHSVQAGAIHAALEERDVLGIAQTGTGKTASFTL